MMPGARLQAAVELLAAIHGGTSPADRVSAAFFRQRRYMGGQDRRDVIDRVYAVLRRRSALDWWIDRTPSGPPEDRERARVIASLVLIDGWNADRIAGSFDGGHYRPDPLDRAEALLARSLAGQPISHPAQPRWVRLEYPEWLDADLADAFGERLEAEMSALMVEASLDLRCNSLKATREEAIAALARDDIIGVPTPLSPLGLRVRGRPALAATESFRSGLVEVQDEGSQLIALLTDARPGMRVVDFCAGAGGKTLALAAAMGNKGSIVASDVLAGRVERAATRLRRAGAHNVTRRAISGERDPWVKRHAGGFDRVLVDAPCGGSGTWRRNPDAKWRFSREDLGEVVALQKRILASAARLVRPGGRLIYATCSLLSVENQEQVGKFLAGAPDFSSLAIEQVWGEAIPTTPCPTSGPWLSLTPASHGTDGFFVAVMQRAAVAAKT